MINKFNSLINIIFPQICSFCGNINEKGLCNKCEIKFKRLAENGILNKKSENMNFENLIYIFRYEGKIRNLIIDYKFNEKAYIYETFVNFILKQEKIFEKMKSYDTIIPVPISKQRKKERGYNQSLLIAKKISNSLNIKLETRCLYKTKNIIAQSKLNKEERNLNIQNAYELKNEQIIKNKQILLVDDIYTTGNTVNECARMLQKAQPKKIDVFVIAKD